MNPPTKKSRAWYLNGWIAICGSVPSIKFRENSDLPKIVAKSILEALVAIAEYKAIHCGAYYDCTNIFFADKIDINPNNIFLSNIDGKPPVVKVGDLGQSELHVRSEISGVDLASDYPRIRQDSVAKSHNSCPRSMARSWVLAFFGCLVYWRHGEWRQY